MRPLRFSGSLVQKTLGPSLYSLYSCLKTRYYSLPGSRARASALIAITSHYNPMTLRVTPGSPVFTDPNATIAWSANLSPDFKTDISFKTFLGRGSGESFQMKFEGDGFVVVQPYEEVYLATGA